MRIFRRLPAWLRRSVVRVVTPSYTMGAVAVLRRPDGQIALVEQRHSAGWALPGGLLHRGEAPGDGLVREIEEELGMTIDRDSLPVPFASVNARVRRVDVVYFLDAPSQQRLQREDKVEVTRTGWFELSALPVVSEPTMEILHAVGVL